MFNEKQFISDAMRTESLNYSVNNVPVPAIYHALNATISVGETLDEIKKSLFYNKPFKQKMYLTALVPHLKEEKVSPRIVHAGIGISTESAEVIEALRDALFTDKELDLVNLKEELGDLMWYIALMMDELGTDFTTEADRVIEKLRARYPEKFTDDLAENRDLTKERIVLEKSYTTGQESGSKVYSLSGEVKPNAINIQV